MNKAVFIDRDGVICHEKNLFYQGRPITKPEDFEWIPKSREALKLLASSDYLTAIVTNQAIIGKGAISLEEFHEANQQLRLELENSGKRFGIYVCHHKKEDNCECKKPKIGMIIQARNELEINLKDSWVIGDKTSDIQMGKNAGCRTILVETGYGGKDRNYDVQSDFTAKDLYEAVLNIISNNLT